MKLSDYLEAQFKGEFVWPLINLNDAVNGPLVSEREINRSNLKTVSLRKTVEYYTHLDIEVEFQGKTYSTAFMWDDQTLIRSLYNLLKENIGHSLGEIGDLEFPVSRSLS